MLQPPPPDGYPPPPDGYPPPPDGYPPLPDGYPPPATGTIITGIRSILEYPTNNYLQSALEAEAARCCYIYLLYLNAFDPFF